MNTTPSATGPSTPTPLNLTAAFESFNDHWSPRIATELNGQKVALFKAKGEFDWHHHEHEDELFLVHNGTLLIDFRDEHNAVTTITLNQGDILTIPKGLEHRPRTAQTTQGYEEAHVVLFEPTTTLNTGSATSNHTVQQLPRL